MSPRQIAFQECSDVESANRILRMDLEGEIFGDRSIGIQIQINQPSHKIHGGIFAAKVMVKADQSRHAMVLNEGDCLLRGSHNVPVGGVAWRHTLIVDEKFHGIGLWSFWKRCIGLCLGMLSVVKNCSETIISITDNSRQNIDSCLIGVG